MTPPPPLCICVLHSEILALGLHTIECLCLVICTLSRRTNASLNQKRQTKKNIKYCNYSCLDKSEWIAMYFPSCNSIFGTRSLPAALVGDKQKGVKLEKSRKKVEVKKNCRRHRPWAQPLRRPPTYILWQMHADLHLRPVFQIFVHFCAHITPHRGQVTSAKKLQNPRLPLVRENNLKSL